jgi:hypothetical protein
MTTTFFVKCLTCKGTVRIRAGLGHDKNQPHEFSCPHCAASLSFRMLLNQEKVTHKVVDLKNMRMMKTPRKDFQAIVVNLHPDFVVPAEYSHDPYYFPFVHQFFGLGADRAQKSLSRLRILVSQWPTIRRALTLYSNHRFDLFKPEAEFVTGVPAPVRPSLELVARSQFWSILHYLALLLFAPSTATSFRSVQDSVKSLFAACPDRVGEYYKYVERDHEEHFAVVAERIIGYFFDHLHLFRPLLLHRLCEVDTRDFGELPRMTRSSFDQLSHFYGEIYEAVGDFALHFTALNNIGLRGSYVAFEHWTLKKYLESDKASRLDPFKDCKIFNDVVDPFYDNQLRNGSHHGRIRYESSSGDVHFWPKRGKLSSARASRIGLWEYMEKCYDLTQALGMMISVHHGLDVCFAEEIPGQVASPTSKGARRARKSSPARKKR